jgi:arylsulfatase A-like enzyme
MINNNKQVTAGNLSYWKIFRLTFVVFSLYLLRDAFYRWDGFKYHSTFSEFIPSVSLVMILWSILAAFTALLIWILLRSFEWFCKRMGWNINLEFLLVFIGIFSLFVIVALIGKGMITKSGLALLSKLIIFLSLFLIAIFLTWRFRHNFDIVHERITPLVLLFGILAIVSIPIVGYHTWLKQTNNFLSQRVSQSSIADVKRPDIIMVSFDALTARDMSVYGYNRLTTPFINEWSKTASLFTRLESASNWTSSTAASMMTGKRVWTHRMFQGDSKLFKSDTESLPLTLKNNGYYNMAFVVNGYASVKRLGVANGFDIIPRNTELAESRTLIGIRFGSLDVILSRLFGDKIKSYSWIIFPDFILGKLLREIFLYPSVMTQTEAPPESAFKYFLKTIDNGVPGPFFAWIHVLPPHDPYLPDETYMGMFNSSPKLRSFDKQMEEEVEAHTIKNNEDWGIYRARYDEFIRFCDKQFEDFIKEIRKREQLKDAIVILTADHGESFEHGYFTHNTNHHYEQVTNIPLIIEEPDRNVRVIINDLIEQIDVPPTILSLANIPVPSWMEGRSLLPLMRGEQLPSKYVYSMSFQKNPSTGGQITKGTIAVWEDDYKLIYYLDENKSLLFNLKDDPGELKNLFNEKKDIGQQLLSLIQNNLKKANERISKGD